MTNALAKDDQHDKLMGQQFREQYHRATGGIWEVVKFGSMMMMLRAHIISTRGNVRTGGAGSKDSGIKAWVEEFAGTDVKLPTAYRFEDVAKAVAQKYELPARVAKKLTFEQLVTADPSDLDANALKAQTELNGFVAGTSQRSWLDDFREAKDKGGARNRKCPHCAGAIKSKKVSVCPHCGKDPSTPPSEEEQKHTEALEAWTLLSTEAHDRAFGEGIYKAEWDLLTTAELAEIDARLFRVHELFRDAIKARKGK